MTEPYDMLSSPRCNVRCSGTVLNDMTTPQLTVTFPTALGRCGLRWAMAGIQAVQLPSHRTAGGRGIEGAPGAEVPAFVLDAIEAMTAVLDGEPHDLRGIP